ncbi:RNA-binding domain-containing protein [Aspergillus pseudoustus]|uniref:RNA-binding domain-containing protein n=1 Tax=Aspergillus pseudoustus TaxID=1810923 RepID=A0ABR4J251_9EURO
MSNQVYVGNLAQDTTSATLESVFREYGAVSELKIMQDRETQASRGFGFVTYSTPTDAAAAVDGLNDTE